MVVNISAKRINVSELKAMAPFLKAGDTVLLSGKVYTARDAAHKRLMTMADRGESLPFPLDGAAIYYAGPTPTPPGLAIGSCGPTTSCRMDVYTPALMDMGLICTIGKGERSEEVYDAIVRNGGVYLCALGGAGALAARCVTKCTVIAFEDLGCESIKELEFEDFPLIVAADCSGGVIFRR